MKEEKEILEHFAGVVSVFFFPCDCLNSLLLSVSVRSIVRRLQVTLPFLLLYMHL